MKKALEQNLTKKITITFHRYTSNHLSVIYFRNLLLSLDKLKNTNLYFKKQMQIQMV